MNQSTVQVTEAESRLNAVLDAIKQCGDGDPRVALSLQNLGAVQFSVGRYDDAVASAERCLRVVQENAPEPGALARVQNNLAVIKRHANDASRAEQLFEAALTSANQAPDAVRSRLQAMIRVNRGVLRTHRGNFTGAEEDFRSALKTHEEMLGGAHRLVADIVNDLAVAAYRQQRDEEAHNLFKRALAIWEQASGLDDPRVALGRGNIAALYRTQGYYTEAEWYLQRALRIWDRKPKSALSEMFGPFFTTLMDAPETGLLRPVDLMEEPLTLDLPDAFERLPEYGKSVRALRSQLEEKGSGRAATVERLKATVEKLGPWYHNIQLAGEVTTNPVVGEHPASRWRILEPFVPKSLAGKSVLDIGCNAGYFSLEMKRRGASRVVGIDIMPHVLAQARFVSAWHDMPIELREMDTYDVTNLGTFDFVVFVGVLYHLEHPLYALQKISSICKETMLFQSVVRGPAGDFTPKDDYPNSEAAIFDLPEYPKMYFIEKSFNGDVSNWWFATQSCLKAMVRTAGFKTILPTASPDTFICHK